MMKPTVALVGRPNVGKSTLFNRLSKRKKAIVHDFAGVTRDRKYADASLGPIEFIVVDTPGLEEAEEGSVEHGMTSQTLHAVQMADLVCLVVDGSVGITPSDRFFANLIRKNNKNFRLIVNKCEKNADLMDNSFFKLGFGEPVMISAEHGLGMADLCEEMIKALPEDEEAPEDPFKSSKIQMAVVGRPNSGKSTFINSLLKENRLLTGPEAGITRDSIEIEWEYKDQKITLIDTAGLRKKSNINESLEKLSTADTITSIKYANTVILMLDATKALEQQDLNIANFIVNEGRALVIAVNKWDLVENKKAFKEEFEYRLEVDLSQISGINYVCLSALDGQNTHKVIESCLSAYEIWNKRISTNMLNKWLAYATDHHPLPLQKNGRRLRIKYATQIKSRPPTFKFFCNIADDIPLSYRRYLQTSLRQNFDLPGVPMRIDFVTSDNPYKK
ncbi:MAG: ribosome biogenesis GTPase Der [Rickettsiaceae bacterium]|nr:ribosome biogenesis GTPase Der [Rickettsiaceae bacterium]